MNETVEERFRAMEVNIKIDFNKIFQTYHLSHFYLQTLRYQHCWSYQYAGRVSYELRNRPHSPWSLCGSVVEHWSTESDDPRFNSSWGQKKNIFLYDMSIFVKLLIDLYNLSCFPEIKTNFLCLLTSALFVTVFTRSSQQLQRIKEQVTRNKAH